MHAFARSGATVIGADRTGRAPEAAAASTSWTSPTEQPQRPLSRTSSRPIAASTCWCTQQEPSARPLTL
ncbi:MAG TPA: hypothetical protein VNS80_08140 [Pseudolysinimonas sp.]|nr:hypothetical protein [Pseudolysinimonas sp.]